MADEIAVTGRISILSGSYAQDFNPGTILADLSSKDAEGGTVSVSSSATAVDMTNVSTPGFCYLRHVGEDTEADVLVGRSDGGTFRELIQLKPGEFAILRLATTNLYHKTASGTGTLQYFIQAS